jgi:hypothetical protein
MQSANSERFRWAQAVSPSSEKQTPTIDRVIYVASPGESDNAVPENL